MGHALRRIPEDGFMASNLPGNVNWQDRGEELQATRVGEFDM